VINHQLALSRSPFQTAHLIVDGELFFSSLLERYPYGSISISYEF
jgi:hypothetical protein